MDLVVLLSSLLSLMLAGIALGYLFSVKDSWKEDLDARQELRGEFQKTLHVITEGHNKLVVQMAETADRVSDLSLRANMGAKR